MSYLVLARKWRPMTFDDLVGQEHVSRTLSNAILSGRIAHAFLFTGVRGVGKTTSARVLAKSLNCEQGPTSTPCLKCPACQEITSGNDMDVQEIDGASYTGVDEVRRLQESLPYRPSRDRFKVIIVDEVHMLSQNAWNAFLKTLEEPPAHVKFIFATTEVHKVPVTILSRCQRYDFKLISAAAIGRRLRFVLDQEGITADEQAIALMSREARGSMRDAMSLMDQAIAWGGDKLVGEEIARVLGVAGRSMLHELSTHLLLGNAAGCVAGVDALADQGYDLVQLARDVLEYLRDLIVVKVSGDDAGRLTELTNEEQVAAKALVDPCGVDDLLRVHLGFSQGFDQVVHAPQQRSALEMLLVRLSRRPPLQPIDELLGRVNELQRKLGRSGNAPAPASRGGSRSSPVDQGPGSGGSRASAVAVAASRATQPEVMASARVEAHVAPAPKHPSPEPLIVAALEHVSPEPLTAVALPNAMDAWRAILAEVRGQSVSFAAILEHASLLHASMERLDLGFEKGSFYETQAREEKAVDLLTRIVRNYFGAPTAVSFRILDEGAPQRTTTVYEADEAERQRRLAEDRRRLEQHPLVQTAMRSLGARIQDIKLSEKG